MDLKNKIHKVEVLGMGLGVGIGGKKPHFSGRYSSIYPMYSSICSMYSSIYPMYSSICSMYSSIYLWYSSIYGQRENKATSVQLSWSWD